MKLKHKILILCFSIFIKTKAQNLVPNGSFETYTTCPTGGSQINLAIPWQGVTTNSTDYYNACSNTYNVPSVGAGDWQYARTGVAYAGIWAINSYGGDYREYLQIKLDSTLIQDSCYLVEFYCNPIDAARYCVNKMGAYLSNTAVSAVGPLPNGLVLQYTPQIVSHGFLNDTLNWMRVGGYYKANGGERYITIGNFSTDSATDTLHLGGSNYDGAYYFIDDVTVKKLTGCDSTLSVPEFNNDVNFKLYPNPNDGNMIFEYSLATKSIGEFIIYDITGRVINKYKLNDGQTNLLNISESELRNGVYFYSVIIDYKVNAYNKIIIVK